MTSITGMTRKPGMTILTGVIGMKRICRRTGVTTAMT